MQDNQTSINSNTEVKHNKLSLLNTLSTAINRLNNFLQKESHTVSSPAIDNFINEIISAEQLEYILKQHTKLVNKAISIAKEEIGIHEKEELYELSAEYIRKNMKEFYKTLEKEEVYLINFALDNYFAKHDSNYASYFSMKYNLHNFEQSSPKDFNEILASRIKSFLDEHKQNTAEEDIQETIYNKNFHTLAQACLYDEADKLDGHLVHIYMILERQSEIAGLSISGATGPDERAELDQEFQDLVAEIDRIAENTNLNSIKMIDGSLDNHARILPLDHEAKEKKYITEIHSRMSQIKEKMSKLEKDDEAVTYLEQEYLGLGEELDRLLPNTNLNSIKMIDGSLDKSLGLVESSNKVESKDILPLKFSLNTEGNNSYNLLDGDTLVINGVTFTAKPKASLDDKTGSDDAQEKKPSNLAIELKAAIDDYIAREGQGYEKLLGMNISINPSNPAELVFTHKEENNNVEDALDGGPETLTPEAKAYPEENFAELVKEIVGANDNQVGVAGGVPSLDADC